MRGKPLLKINQWALDIHQLRDWDILRLNWHPTWEPGTLETNPQMLKILP
jgi:hypothetical protein